MNLPIELQKQDILLKHSELQQQKEEIMVQAENLFEANAQIMTQNDEILQKHEKMRIQSEKIDESNKMIEKQNASLIRQKNEVELTYKKIQFISNIGKDITASLDLDHILDTMYKEINQLMDATIFGIGVYLPEKQEIEYKIAIENGIRYAPYSRSTRDKNQLPVWCIDEKSSIFINDMESELANYIQKYDDTEEARTLEDGTVAKKPASLLYAPLLAGGQILGVVTVQSYKKFAYKRRDMEMLESIGAYTAIALANARNHGKSEKLLLNILPAEVAEELKNTDKVSPRYYEQASVLFTDFKGFTQISEKSSPQNILKMLNRCFEAFDGICEKYGLEKIKTIGDSYMCCGGVPTANSSNAIDCVAAGLEMQAFMSRWKEERESAGLPAWELRLGIHTGPLIAGVIGTKKFSYDVWGDTVNTASRMESSGEPGRVNISEATYAAIVEPQGLRFHPEAQNWRFEFRGKISAKGKGEMGMYFVK